MLHAMQQPALSRRADSLHRDTVLHRYVRKRVCEMLDAVLSKVLKAEGVADIMGPQLQSIIFALAETLESEAAATQDQTKSISAAANLILKLITGVRLSH